MVTGRLGSLLVKNAHVLTMDPAQPTARAIVVHDGEITFVGSEEGAAQHATSLDTTIDAKGRTVLPGFNDAHGHFIHDGMMSVYCDLSQCVSIEDAYHTISTYVAANPEAPHYICERWDESQWPERVMPTRLKLDAICWHKPLIARRIDGHTAVANSPMLALFESSRWKGPTDGIHSTTGLLLEEPSLQAGELLPDTDEQQQRAIELVMEKAARLGCTSFQDYARPQGYGSWQRFQARLDQAGEHPPVRTAISIYSDFLDGHDRPTGDGDPWFHMGGMKIFADGALGGWTAYLREPYTDKPDTRGKLNFVHEELVRLVSAAERKGIQVHLHVIGDGAVDEGVRAYHTVHDGLDDTADFLGRRHRFEHYEMGTTKSHQAVVDLGLVPSMQPNFVGTWSTKDGMYGDRLGPERHKQTNHFRTLIDMGAPLAFGSDCMPFSPLIGIQGAVGAPYTHQRITFQEAVHAYTVGAAYAEHREREKGMLKTGMHGDLVMLDHDLRHVNADDASVVAGLGVATTVSAGRITYGDGADRWF